MNKLHQAIKTGNGAPFLLQTRTPIGLAFPESLSAVAASGVAWRASTPKFLGQLTSWPNCVGEDAVRAGTVEARGAASVTAAS